MSRYVVSLGGNALAAACPTGAIKLRKNGTPKPVDKSLCIGCGACQAVCPATPKKAMTVLASL